MTQKMQNKTYADGLTDGRLNSLEAIAENHSDRLDVHSNRLRKLERILWIAGGFVIAVQAIPAMQTLFGLLGPG